MAEHDIVALPLCAASADLAASAAEPIRVPGAVQPHGALLVLDPATLAMRQRSANLAHVTGLALAPGDQLSGAEDCAAMLAETRRWFYGDDPIRLRVRIGARRLQLQGGRTPQRAILEFEDPPESESENPEGLYPRLWIFLNLLSTAADLRSITDAAVREVRAMIGFPTGREFFAACGASY